MACTTLPRLLVTSFVSLVGITVVGAPMASAQVHDRITTAIAGASPVAIPNTVNPKAKLGTDLGPTAGNTGLSMSIRFNMTDAQQAALSQLLANQQNPASPQYHQWLTPAQYAAQFGMSSNDLAKVSAWLTSQGFTVTGTANGGTFITFKGTVAQADAAFSTSIHNVSVNGETHYANLTDVSVPSAFAGTVAAVTGLHNFRLKPRLKASVVSPKFTSSVSGDHFMAPGDAYTIYNANNLLNNGITGSGETIAVTGQVDVYAADISAFRSASGLSTTNLPTTIHANGSDPGYPVCNSCTTGPNEGDLEESSIDLEWSGAMAPSATIDFVNGVDVMADSMTYAIDNDLAPIVTTSYGLCEAGWGSSELFSLNSLFEQAATQGQTVLAAAGDDGAADCDVGPTAIEGLAVDFPGSSPYVTSMGGTQFNDGSATGATQYWSASNGSTSGSAISYIPESVWNDEPAFNSFGGGGGGPSAFFTKPAWQVGTAADAARDVPDLALDASDGQDPYLFCVNVASGISCTNGYRIANNDLEVAGGTSFDSQIFGGFLALIEQKNGGARQGSINPLIYALGNSKYYAAGQNTLTNSSVVFNDVTLGNNDMPCGAGTPNCGNGGQEGFSAGSGYDLGSGWGTPNVTNLANDWTLVTPLGIGSLGSNVTTTALAATPTSAAAGATVTLTATVVGSTAATPTGTVQFLANNVALGSAVNVTGTATSTATATYSWVTGCSNLGQQVMSASYSGDMNYQGSRGPLLTVSGASETPSGASITSPLEVQVTSSTCADFSITPVAASGINVSGTNATVSVAAGGVIPSISFSVAPINNFTGTVVFSGTATSTSGYPLTLTFSPTSQTISSSSPVTTTLSVSGITASLDKPSLPGRIDPGRTPWYAAGSGVAVAGLVLLVLPRRRRFASLLMVALAVALAAGASGCGSSGQQVVSSTGSSTGNSSNPYAGTYIVTVIGTYTSSSGQVSQHTATVTYSIN